MSRGKGGSQSHDTAPLPVLCAHYLRRPGVEHTVACIISNFLRCLLHHSVAGVMNVLGLFPHKLQDRKTMSVCPSARPSIRSSVSQSIRAFIHSFIHSFAHSLIHSFTHSLVHSFTHSFTHSFIPSIHRSVHPCIHPLMAEELPAMHWRIQRHKMLAGKRC